MFKRFILRWLGLAEVEGRLKNLERHFVTKRNESGQITETLADVPLKDRKERTRPTGMSAFQRRAWLEATDGGRFVNRG